MKRAALPMFDWRLDPASPTVLYRQIYERVRAAIRGGALKPAQRLPAARTLASHLAAARGTVEAAYGLLAAEGYIITRGAAGTFVASGLGANIVVDARRSARPAKRMGNLDAAAPTAAPLQLGLPALDLFPKSVWSRLLARRARGVSMEDLTGPESLGHLPLRQALASYLAVSRGVLCDPGQIVITSGFQGAVGLIASAYVAANDTVCVEDPGYPNVRQAFAVAGASVTAAAVDTEGLNVTAMLRRTPQPRIVCVTPAHQSPTGVSLSLARRLTLLGWASEARAWILEDDYDSEFRYDSRPLPALKSLDDAGRVLYAGSFSKVLFPALRLGYLVIPHSEIGRVSEVNRLLYRAAPRLIQAAVADFMLEGHFARHIRRMRSRYQERRTALADALNTVFEGELQVQLASGGMHLIAKGGLLKEDREAERRARQAGLAPSALSHWYKDPRQRESGLLLGFTNLPVDRALEVAMRLKKALHS